MSRTNKDYEEKKNKLSISIWNIFLMNGYEETSLANIIKTLNISKGAFYHYFESKESCLNYAINNYINKTLFELNNILEIHVNLNAIEKFKLVLTEGLNKHHESENDFKNIHAPSNIVLHQKLLVEMTKQFAPVFAKIIIQGINEGSFKTEHPLEVSQTILTISNFLLNNDLFNWTREELMIRLDVLEETMTLLLHAEPGVFSYIKTFC